MKRKKPKNVVTITPEWELAKTDKEGNWIFHQTRTPRRLYEEKEAASKKVMKEMESRQKL